MATVELDLGYLARHLEVAPDTLSTVSTAPTVDLVRVVLQAAISKAREFDQLCADKINVDIELENVVRGSEARCQSFKATAEKSLREVEEIRIQLQREESARQVLENDLQSARSSTSNNTSEIENLQARIASLQTSNRETLAVVDSKTSANAELLQDLQRLQQKNAQVSKQVAELQQNLQTEKAAANSAKWREQNIQQELKLSRQNNEWLETELKTKRDEATKTRKEKGARISELERLNEDIRVTIESLTRTEQQLRSRLTEAQQKAEDSLAKLQQLQEGIARTEEGFRQEIESSKRLVELKEQQTETHRRRLQEVEERLEKQKDEEIALASRLQTSIETERSERQAAEQQVDELQREVDQLRSAPVTRPAPDEPPQTPRANGGFFRGASPFRTPGSLRGKVGISATQAIDELWKAKSELAAERKRTQQLSQDLDEMMSVLEAKQPELEELQEETERLRNENVQITQLADDSYRDRDIAKRAARKAEALANTRQAELGILRSQLRDLGTQIQLLVFNIRALEKGEIQLSAEEEARFAQLQRGETAESALDDMSDTHRFITERFVTFKNITELQSKNEELLRITRELADKMESEESLATKRQAAKNEEELVALRESSARLQDEMKSMTVRIQSHMTERDMFRRLLQQKGAHHGPAAAALDLADRQPLGSIEAGSSVDEAEIATALRELQKDFDDYRNEQSTDRKTMREQVDKLSSEKNTLQGEISKVRSQLELASERYAMLQSNLTAAQNDKAELQRRSQLLSENAARQEVRTQQLAADLVESKALFDSVSSKCANLEAEKELSASIRERLNQDHELLTQEKARLSTLITQQQTLLNERESSETETRRVLSEQTESLKAELTTTKRKLTEETEESKKLHLRKEYEAQQQQKRIDDLVTALNTTKEQLIAAKTSKDHLQARVDELTIELRTAQEKADRLMPRPTPRANEQSQPAAVDEETEAQIQELVNEVTDLRRDVELANSHLHNAKMQVEQYKQISQAAEEELGNIGQSHEQYQEEVEAALASKDKQIKELTHRIDDISSELAQSNNELSSLRDSQTEAGRKIEEEKRILETEVARLQGDADRFKERAKYNQQDLRAQAEIAKKAQQDYEHELLKHAEAAKMLQDLRTEHSKLRTEAASSRAEADSAKHTLEDSKQSWTEREQQLRQEVADFLERRKETEQQNRILQEQLNSVTQQISSIKETRATLMAAAEGTVSSAGSDTERLLELNNYLSREKDIIEVQYNLKVHETERLQQQLSIKQTQLDEAQLRLEQERVAGSDNRSSVAHQDLMNKLNELNLIRESNVTLRNEKQRVEKELTTATCKVSELQAIIEPLQTRVTELEGQKEFLDEEMKQLAEDRDRWQNRTQGILTKYGRVDPEETEQMKQKMASLEAERDALKQGEEPLRAKIREFEAALEAEKANWKASREKIIDQAKERSRQQNARNAELSQQKDAVETELVQSKEKLQALEAELTVAQSGQAEADQQIAALRAEVEVASGAAETPAPAESGRLADDARAELEQQLISIREDLAAISQAKSLLEEEVANLTLQLTSVTAERDALRLGESSAADAVPIANGATDTVAPTAAEADTEVSSSDRTAIEERLAAAEARGVELEAQLQELEKSQNDIIDKRSKKMKEQLNKRLGDSKEELLKEFESRKQAMSAEYDLRLQQERTIWESERSSSNGTGATVIPAGSLLSTDFSTLSDVDSRELLDKNSTLKTIVLNNVKKKIDIESKKLRPEIEQAVKTEWEGKLATAKEQAAAMESKRSNVRISMADNNLKRATAKLNVVETAAKETPERAVGEVWAIAKDAKPAPAAAVASGSAAGTPSKLNPAAATATASAPVAAAPASTANGKVSGIPAPNPFGNASLAVPAATSAVNPFGATSAAASPTAPSQPAAVQQQQQQQQQQQPQQHRTGIPVPRGGGVSNLPRGGGNAGRGALYQAGRGGGAGRVAQSRISSGSNAGAGGAASAAATLNPGAETFNPNHKRPRSDADGKPSGAGGNGGHQQQAKRQRGGGGGQGRGG